MLYNYHYRNEELQKNLLLIGVIFLVNPLCGIILSAIFVANRKNYDLLYFLIVLLILYLGAINTTKVPENDMLDYLGQFNNVPRSGFWKNLSFLYNGVYIKDPGYGVLVYVLHYLTFGNQKLFIFIITALTYGFTMIALLRVGKEYKLPIYIVVSEILFIAFFSQFFNLSMQLVRQQLATSVFMFALSVKIKSFKTYIISCAAALSIHSSMTMPILLSLIPYLQKKMSFKKIVISSLIASSFFILMTTIASNLVGASFLGKGELAVNMTRLSAAEGTRDASDDMSKIFTTFIPLILMAISLREMWRKEVVSPYITNMCFMWSVIILSLHFSPFLQYRYFFMLYSFLPFVVFLLFRQYMSWGKPICSIIVAINIIRYFYTLNSTFQFISTDEAIMMPYFYLIQL